MREIVGIFGGTFDPVHNGHTETILHLLTLIPFKKIMVIPSARPPHREKVIGSFEDRLVMARLAFKNHKRISVEDREVLRSGPSYAIDTVKEIMEEEKRVQLVVIVGSDAFADIDSWHKAEELLRLVNFVVMKRPDFPILKSKKSFQFIKKKSDVKELLQSGVGGKIFAVQVKPLKISSSVVRENLTIGKSIDSLVEPSVRKYLISHKLYVSKNLSK